MEGLGLSCMVNTGVQERAAPTGADIHLDIVRLKTYRRGEGVVVVHVGHQLVQRLPRINGSGHTVRDTDLDGENTERAMVLNINVDFIGWYSDGVQESG